MSFSYGQSQVVITKKGKRVILKPNKTWEYIGDSLFSDNHKLEPEYSNRPYYVNNNELIRFEKVKAKIDYKTKAMGFGGSNTYFTSFGIESSTKFKKGKIPSILIKIEGMEDPEESIIILKSEKTKKNKDRRRFKQASMSLGGKSRDVSDNEISFKLKKVSHNIYKLEIDETIDLGEYAIIPESSKYIYCFAIN